MTMGWSLPQRRASIVLLLLQQLIPSTHLFAPGSIILTGIESKTIYFPPEKVAKPIVMVKYKYGNAENATAELCHDEYGKLKMRYRPDLLDAAMIQAGVKNKKLDIKTHYIATQEELEEVTGSDTYTLSTGIFVPLSKPGVFHQASLMPDALGVQQLMVHVNMLAPTTAALYYRPHYPLDGNQLVALVEDGGEPVPPHVIPKWLRIAIRERATDYHLLGRETPGGTGFIVLLSQIQKNLLAKLVWKAGGGGEAMRLLHYRKEPFGEAEPDPIYVTADSSQFVIYENGEPISLPANETAELVAMVAKNVADLYCVKEQGGANHGKWVVYPSR